MSFPTLAETGLLGVQCETWAVLGLMVISVSQILRFKERATTASLKLQLNLSFSKQHLTLSKAMPTRLSVHF